jgi:hypothetical protein
MKTCFTLHPIRIQKNVVCHAVLFCFLFFSWRELVIPVLFGSVVHLQYAELSIRAAKYSQKAFEFYTAVLNFALYITNNATPNTKLKT